MDGFDPTHTIPPEGLEARAAPDPGQAPAAVIDPGVQVVIQQRQGDWAEIRCDNGWTGWVDGRALLAAASVAEPAAHGHDAAWAAGADPAATGANVGGAVPAKPATAGRSIGPAALVAALVAAALIALPVVAAGVQSVASAGPAGADLVGCKGQAQSTVNGVPLSSVDAPGGPASSPTAPFVVERDAQVPWSGSTDAVITANTWQVRTYGIPVRSGGGPNDERKSQSSGNESAREYLRAPFVGLFEVTGSLTGTGGSCTGSMWVKVNGSPLATPVFWLGALLFVLGGLVIFFGRPRPVRVASR